MGPEVIANMKLFSPELSLVALLMVLFATDALEPKSRSGFFPLIATLIACVAGSALALKVGGYQASGFFSNLVANDGLSLFFRLFFFFACGASLYIAYGSKELKAKNRMEFTLLLVCVTFGMTLMATSTHLLMLYIGIETVSIVSFVMAGFNRDNLRSNEASLKYLIYGALASGLMLYGFSLIYGYAGSLQYAEVNRFLVSHSTPGQASLPFIVGAAILMIYAGLAFKISAFPMHYWTPDVYEGAPTPVATFFSVGPKAAGFAALLRIFLSVFATKTGATQWTALEGNTLTHGIAILAAVTMAIGNLSALGQTNVKRILAYSSIAHVGYILMGFVALNELGISAILFYLVVYCAMNMGAFWVVSIVSDLKGSEDLEAFRGLGWRMPILGVCMGIFLFSLTGIPVFAGFIGKFLIFGAVLSVPGYLWLAIWGVLNSVISLYYYAKVVKAMWLDQPAANTETRLSFYHAFGLVLLALPTVFLGLFFSPVIRFARASLAAFLS